MSLTTCIKQAGRALRPADKAAILALSRTYRADGLSPDEAGKKAIAEQIAAVQKLIAKEQAKPADKPAQPLYASRAVTNAADIVAWAQSQGFKTTLPASDMHVTVAYSGAPVQGSKAGTTVATVAIGGGKRSVEPLGDGGAIVLKFASDDLQTRWQQYRDAGASWDYEGYTPHVTLTYDGSGVDLSKVIPYAGPITLGAEKQEVLDPDAKDKITEAPTLTSPTQADILSQQQAKEDGEKASAKAKRDTDKKLADEQTAKDNASRFAGAVDNFKLGETADQNLSGQDAMFARGTTDPGRGTKTPVTNPNDDLTPSIGEYRDGHTAPMRDSGAPSYDVTGDIYPEDFYGPNGERYYGTGDARTDGPSIRLVQSLRGKPEASVTIYRAVPKEPTNPERIAQLEKEIAAYMKRKTVPDTARLKGSDWYNDASDRLAAMKAEPEAKPAKQLTINHGDWVTINKQYAKDHGEGALNGQYEVISKKVKAKDIYTNGDSIHEWGYDPANPDIRFIFAGKQAATADTYQLETAERRLKNGVRPEAVLRDTGWSKGVDGKMRFEISDKDALLKAELDGPNKGKSIGRLFSGEDYRTLGAVLHHPALFAAYPTLANMPIKFVGSIANPGVRGSLGKDGISISEDASPADALSTLLHEIQHGIQGIEGFASGGSPDAIYWTAKKANEKINGYNRTINTVYRDLEAARAEKDVPRATSLKAQYDELLSKRSDLVDAAQADPLDTYRRLAGEVEARNTQTRAGFSDEERRLMPAYTTADVKDSDVIVTFNGTDMHSAPAPANGRARIANTQKAYTPPNGTPDTRPEAAANIGVLGSSIARYFGIPGAKVNALHPYDARVLPGDAALREIAQAFGSRIQGFDLSPRLLAADRTRFGFFTGVRTGGIVFINSRNADRAHIAVLGHELAHELATKNPALYQQFVDAVRPYVDQQKYSTAFVNSIVAKNAGNTDKQREEFMGEVLSDGFMDREFWRALGNKNPSLLQKIGNSVMDLVERALRTLGYTKRTEPYLTDYKKVMQIAGEVMAEFGVAPTRAAGADTRFAAADQTETAITKSKHSPEQMAKWAAEKDARYQSALQADARQRERDRASLARQQERLSKSEMWNRFTPAEKASVNHYDSAEDRNVEGAKQAVNAIERALKSAGITIEKTSASNDGKSKSIYVKVGNEIVRVSDHELPATPLRQHNRATGFAGKWNREVIIYDWQSTGMDEYLQQILGGAPTASRLEYESQNGAEAPNGAQSGGSKGDSSTTVPASDDTTNPDIAFARGTANLFQPNIWSTPENSKIDTFLYNVQDGKIDLRRTQEAILKSGQTIAEQYDARLAETLYPGRVAHRSQTFLEVEAQPLLKAMHSNKVGMDELADYLHARGAEERNVQIAKVNPAMPDGGAGTNTKGTLLTTQAAKDYLTAISPTRKMVLDAMAKRVDAITAGTRTLLVTERLEKQETIDAWTAAYKNYVPMFRDEADEGFPSHPQGSGFTVKGSASKRAMGSKKEVTNILAHVLMQREAAITRAEKNRVALALYGQALSHPNPEFWTTIKPGMQAAAIASELVAMGVDPMTAEVGMAGVPTIQTIDPNSGKVVNRPNPMYKMLPGAIPLKVHGEDRVLMLNVKNERGARLATSLKNLDGLTQLDLAGSIVGKSTRWLAAVNTQYNPAFGLVNLTRDTLGGVIHLGNTELRGHSLEVLGKTFPAIIGIALELIKPGQNGKYQKLFRQMGEDGGITGFKENFRDPNERAKAIEKELKALGRGKLSPGRYAHMVLDLLEGFNTTLENAVRLSAYSAALDAGMSRPQAARLDRELTVDFNRKGRLGREVGPLYAFFNASVQGMARTMQAIKGPTGGKIIAGGLSLGILQALMLAAAGYDDDEIPEFVKTRALIIPLFGDKKEFISIPYPLGLHVLPNTGRVLTELVLNGGKDIGKRSVDAIGEIAGAFNPLGGGNILTADGALKTIAPTLLDPIIEVVANKNFAGSSIEKRGFGAETDNRPGVNRVRESTQRSTTGQAYMGISKAMNTATGGSDYEAGAVSPTPEMVRYLAQTVGGGVLREIEKTINASTASARGDKVKASQIPVMGRFYGEVENDDVQRSRYFKTDQEMKKLTSVSRELKKSGTDADMDAYEKKHPELEAVRDWQRAERRIAKLNKLAVETINDPKELRSIDADRAEEMRDLNQTLLDMEKATGKTTPAEEVRKAAVKAGWK